MHFLLWTKGFLHQEILHHSLASRDISPPYFFQLKLYIISAKVVYQSTNLVKFHLSSQKSEIFHCGGLLLEKSNKVSAKTVYTEYLSPIALKSDAKFKRKTDMWFQIWHEEFGEFSPNYLKVRKLYFDGLFLSKVYEVWAKKIQRSYLSWHWTVMQNLNKPWPCGFKNGMRNWVNFH